MSVGPEAKSKLARLSLDQKAHLCSGSDFWHTAGIEEAGIPALRVSDGPHGLRRQPEGGDQVGIGGSLPATCFPTAAGLACSFNPDLARRVGMAVAREAVALGVAVVLGPGINIKRSPLCGRNFEYFSEDPLVSGALGAAMVEGLQSEGVGASVKHYAANNQETDRLRVSAEVDERTLRELYLPAFERVVREARPWTVMCSYNKVNGTYASEHHWLLTKVLREEWGFEGVVVSDWGAVHDRVAALAAGLDLEMPPRLESSPAAIVEAVGSGSVDETVLDRSVLRLLGLVDKAVAAHGTPVQAAPAGNGAAGVADGAAVDLKAHHKLAREAAQECAVLLKNEGNLLPLRPGDGSTVLVVGELARQGRFQGGGSSKVNPTEVDVPLDQLREALAGVDLQFAPGYPITGADEDGSLAEEAIDMARSAETVVMFMGLLEEDESEGYDRQHIDLPMAQTQLLASLAAVNRRIAVVLANGSVVQVSGWEHHARAVLECWLSGQAAGGAVADLLTGVANPSGRLAETIPVRLEDNPAFLNFPGEYGYVRYGEGIFVGYHGFDKVGREVSYPFGHGLSYTDFAYSNLQVSQKGSCAAGDLAVSVSCQVTNTGQCQGQEVVQIYVGDRTGTAPRPVRELKGFSKPHLLPGDVATVTFALDIRDLSYWSTVSRQWEVGCGTFEIAVGASSRDLRLTASIEVEAPAVRPVLTSMSSLQEWLDDPAGRAGLEALMDGASGEGLKGLVADENLVRMIGNFPLSSIGAFVGVTFDDATAERLLSAGA